MKKNTNKKNEYCCKDMQETIEKNDQSVYYDPILRGYYINLKSYRSPTHVIYNCPWCGFIFPKSLCKEYLKILENEFDIHRNIYTGRYYKVMDEGDDYDEIDVDIPEEFKTDEWWKKRGL